MLIFVAMLLLGILAVIWGFMMCFLPGRWDRLTGPIDFADPLPKTLPTNRQPIIKLAMRVGNSVAGFAICSVGGWFAYVAGSQIYLVLIGRSTIHPIAPANGGLPSSPSPGLTALSVFIAVAGVLLALFPRKAMIIFNRIEPAGRAVKWWAVPRILLFLRLFGGALAAISILSLIH